MVEGRKTKAIITKHKKARGGFSLSCKEKRNFMSNTEDETDPDQVDNGKYLLQLWEGEARGSYK